MGMLCDIYYKVMNSGGILNKLQITLAALFLHVWNLCTIPVPFFD